MTGNVCTGNLNYATDFLNLAKLVQILQCLFEKNNFHMLHKVGFHSRRIAAGGCVFRENIADFIKLLCGVFGFFQEQIIVSCLRIFIQSVWSFIDITKYFGSMDCIIQRMKTIEAGQLPYLSLSRLTL